MTLTVNHYTANITCSCHDSCLQLPAIPQRSSSNIMHGGGIREMLTENLINPLKHLSWTLCSLNVWICVITAFKGRIQCLF